MPRRHTRAGETAAESGWGSKLLIAVVLLALAPIVGGRGTRRGYRGVLAAFGKWLGRRASPASVVTTALAGAAIGVSLAPPGTLTLYHTVGEIPPQVFQKRPVISAEVVKITDGDTFRCRHTPVVNLFGRRGTTGRLSDETLLVRLAGVDAPEVAKQGSPGQPFSREARDFVANRVLNKKVNLKLLRRDQYSRCVARVEYGAWPLRKDLSEELLKEGLAVVYRQGGAEYDGRLSRFEQLERQAREDRRGVWSLGNKQESPGQYKARVRQQKQAGKVPNPQPAVGAR